jgi:hypothetical protein
VGLGELLGEGGDDLFAVFGALILQDFGLNTFTDLPVKLGDFGVDGGGGTLFGAIDELANFLEQIVWWGEVVAHGAFWSAVSSPVKAFWRMGCPMVDDRPEVIVQFGDSCR